MDQPLGLHVGNALEVEEILDVLRGEGPDDLRQLCFELAGWMFYLGERTSTVAEGKQLAEKLIRSGAAVETFRSMVEQQGGDPGVIDDPKRLPQAKHTMVVTSPRDGYVTAIACEQVGTACVILGGGRERKEDAVDPAVGQVLHKKVGDRVTKSEPLCTIHYNSEDRAARVTQLMEESYRIDEAPPRQQRPLIHRVIPTTGEKN